MEAVVASGAMGSDAEGIVTSEGDGERMVASGRDAEGKGWWRAERAACRRYAIVVSPTQLVPEVLAVWGSD